MLSGNDGAATGAFDGEVGGAEKSNGAGAPGFVGGLKSNPPPEALDDGAVVPKCRPEPLLTGGGACGGAAGGGGAPMSKRNGEGAPGAAAPAAGGSSFFTNCR